MTGFDKRYACLSLLCFLCWCGVACPQSTGETIPLVYITDFYHSPGDPDDHIDMATLLALPEFDIRAILIDVRPPHKPDANPYEPGFVPISQMCYLTGKSFPVAIGPSLPLRSTSDSAIDRPESEQPAIKLLIKILRESKEKVMVNTVGTCRIIAAAYLREPKLFREKVRALVINAGSSGKGTLEHNVAVDLYSYIVVMRSGLPILWFPCAGDTTNWDSKDAMGPNNTFYRAPHLQLFANLPVPLRSWFTFALSRSCRGDILRALSDFPAKEVDLRLNHGTRNLWSTQSFVLTSGRVLAKTDAGWRFQPKSKIKPDAQVEEMTMLPITFSISDDGQPTWSKITGSSNIQIFQRTPGSQHVTAMTEALNALLREFPIVR